MNVHRFDVGPFVIFINVFTGNSGALYSHHHEDLLSYVLFDRGREVLVDPGKPCYLKPSDFQLAKRHNGIWCDNSLLRPVTRFFTPRALFRDAIALEIDSRSGLFNARARNRHTGAERTLRIEGDERGLRVAEKLHPGRRCARAGLTHCFADAPTMKSGPRAIRHRGLEFIYDADIVLVPGDRAVSYGEPGRAFEVRANRIANEFRWELRRAA